MENMSSKKLPGSGSLYIRIAMVNILIFYLPDSLTISGMMLWFCNKLDCGVEGWVIGHDDRITEENPRIAGYMSIFDRVTKPSGNFDVVLAVKIQILQLLRLTITHTSKGAV